MHRAIINRIDVDAAERYLVTGSDDKTVRVWSLPEGHLLRVLRLPIGEGNEGKVYAVAISPDGDTVAVGGWTGYDWNEGVSIYLFNRATGQMRQRITALPTVINHLAYSPDGHYLVASLYKSGIRIYHSSDYSLHAEDVDYGDRSYWAEFDSKGRLVTSCDDGYIRLYNKQFNLLNKRKAPGGNRPYAARFSPSGDKIAVGFTDSTQVNVLSGEDLSLLYSPDTQYVDNGNLISVAWSKDGRWLYAGGAYDDSTGISPILRWREAGQGGYRTWLASDDTIMDIRALRDGSIVFGAADPSFGLFNANGQKTVYREAEIADFRDNSAGFLLSNDGSRVEFAYEIWGRRPARFSLNERILTLYPTPESNLTAPRTSGLNISDWRHQYQPKFNSKPITLKEHEMARSLAIAPDAQHFILGTDWYLRFFDKQGEQQGRVPVPGVAWEVNIADNGKVAVAAFGDGTLRWYRLRDAKELLAFFPHNDGKRWILWTPQGHYAASPGADSLFGWHINQGPDRAAEFFSAARFRSRYYRPDVVAKVLGTPDAMLSSNEEAERLQQEAIQQIVPPVVTLLSPQDKATFSDSNIELRYYIRRVSEEPITGFKVLVDGRPRATRGLERIPPQPESVQSLRITVPQRDVEVSLIVENRYAASEPATVRLRWRGRQRDMKKPRLYVLAIGVSDYDNNSLDLNYAAQDARDFVKVLGGLSVKLLADASKDEILDGLEWIERQVTQDDVAIVFFAGHGINDINGHYYFLPRNFNEQGFKRTALAYHDIKNTLTVLQGKVLFFIDTTHISHILGGVADVDKIANDLSSAENGVVVFTSSTGKQTSQEDQRWQNGAFTEALVEGLSGAADSSHDGKITINELGLYLSNRVNALTNGKQRPMMAKPETIQDFPIGLDYNSTTN
ncbi:MAG: caspase family protein [Pseudomonadota bacterium]